MCCFFCNYLCQIRDFSAHQTHYEQLGFFRGKLRFPDLEGGEAYREVAVPSFRDHSFG